MSRRSKSCSPARPPAVVEAMGELEGGLLLLGAGGKMGPSLARLAQRASARPGWSAGSSRWRGSPTRGCEAALQCRRHRDDSLRSLRCGPGGRTSRRCPTSSSWRGRSSARRTRRPRTWAVNAYLPGVVATRFPSARIVAFSTGNVYPPLRCPGRGSRRIRSDRSRSANTPSRRWRGSGCWSSSRGRNRPRWRFSGSTTRSSRGTACCATSRTRSRRASRSISPMGRVNVIWQRDANAVALRALAHCAVPPLVLNLTGRPAIRCAGWPSSSGRRLGHRAGVSGNRGRLGAAERRGRWRRCLVRRRSRSRRCSTTWRAGWRRAADRSAGPRTMSRERESSDAEP